MGDRTRLISGDIYYITGEPIREDPLSEIGFSYWIEKNGYFSDQPAPSKDAPGGLGFNSSKVVPTGAANIPRSWGTLACAYFGQPAHS